MNENGDTKYSTIEVPGTAQIRKLSTYMSSMEMLMLCEKLAKEGLFKKLWNVLSRVYEDKKSFEYSYEEGMEQCVGAIMDSAAPTELKLQTFTSFKLPASLLPNQDTIKELISKIDPKRANIAAYFIIEYDLEESLYAEILAKRCVFEQLIKVMSEDTLIDFFSLIFERENKETITGVIRIVAKVRKRFVYRDLKKIGMLTDKAFDTKEVFFTSKLLYCLTFKVPEECVRKQKDLFKILKISINYEERITKDFVKEYHLSFDVSDLAICKYYLGNKKSQNQKNLVNKFACHLVRVQDEKDRSYLLHGAFKRGGYFRLYAGCMQDGYVDMNKMKRFKYSDEDILYVKNLPGLKTADNNTNQ